MHVLNALVPYHRVLEHGSISMTRIYVIRFVVEALGKPRNQYNHLERVAGGRPRQVYGRLIRY